MHMRMRSRICISELIDERDLKAKTKKDTFKAYDNTWNDHGLVDYFVKPKFILSAISCYTRPTAAVFWLMMIGMEAFTRASGNRYSLQQNIKFCTSLLFSFVLGGTLCFALDFLGYGVATCTPYNFFFTNVILNKAAEFGVSGWHWYYPPAIPYSMAVGSDYYRSR